MAAPESTKFQVSFYSADQTLINLYASSKEELESLLNTAQDFSPLIGSVVQSYKGSSSSAPVSSAAPAAKPQVVEGQTPECKHGQMQYRTGNGAKGPWRAWMCAAPKGAPDKCDAIWVR
jgi:hypothetical protein